MQAPIPPEVRRFILTSVLSVPHLEALLLLRGAEAQAWSAGRLAERLYVGEPVAQGLLDDLCKARMVVQRDAPAATLYAYQPQGDTLRGAIDALADAYARNLVEVTHLIHSRLDRQAQHFADAFRWRKDK